MLTFTGVTGGANPAGQSIAIANTGGGTLSWTAASNQPWLTLSTASGTAPSTVTASVSLTGLSTGSLTGQITVTPSVGPPQVIAVTLTLTDPPQLSATPSVLIFTGVTGGTNPAGQDIAIANTGGGTLTWTAASNQPWLTLSTASGTAFHGYGERLQSDRPHEQGRSMDESLSHRLWARRRSSSVTPYSDHASIECVSISAHVHRRDRRRESGWASIAIIANTGVGRSPGRLRQSAVADAFHRQRDCAFHGYRRRQPDQFTAGTLNGQVTVTPSGGFAANHSRHADPHADPPPAFERRAVYPDLHRGDWRRESGWSGHCYHQHRGRGAHLDGGVQSAAG
ncbi:MAG: hypothetical protein R2762_27220 [Bryobacteraceae bacterium]